MEGRLSQGAFASTTSELGKLINRTKSSLMGDDAKRPVTVGFCTLKSTCKPGYRLEKYKRHDMKLIAWAQECGFTCR